MNLSLVQQISGEIGFKVLPIVSSVLWYFNGPVSNLHISNSKEMKSTGVD